MAHPVNFVSSAIKDFAAVDAVEVYIIDDLNDFEYLINDLSPQMIVVHEKLYQVHREQIAKLANTYTDLYFVIVKANGSSCHVPEHMASFDEPFHPNELLRYLRSLLAK